MDPVCPMCDKPVSVTQLYVPINIDQVTRMSIGMGIYSEGVTKHHQAGKIHLNCIGKRRFLLTIKRFFDFRRWRPSSIFMAKVEEFFMRFRR